MSDDSYDVQLGPNRFTAKGQDAGARFDAWLKLVERLAGQVAVAAPPAPAVHAKRVEDQVDVVTQDANGNKVIIETKGAWNLDAATLRRVFTSKGDLETLRFKPSTSDPDADGTLMLIYAFNCNRREDQVLAGRLGKAVRDSGLRNDRIDRIAHPHLRDNFIIKSGRGKGGRYGLSNPGARRAEELIRAASSLTASPASAATESPDEGKE